MPINKEIDNVRYTKTLQRIEWKLKREEILKRDHYQCIFCKSIDIKNLQVHHTQVHYDANTRYHRIPARKLPWKYANKYLMTLCKACHYGKHRQNKLPRFWV